MPNQHSAPMPQDVHPQHYQTPGVGAPPGPQWGVPGPGASGPQGPGPTPPGPATDWSRRLAEIQHPQPQPPNPYDQRDAIRPPPPPPRQPSPRQEPMRHYQEPHRHTPVRRPSPSPKMNIIAPSYPGQQGLPQPAPPQPQQQAPNRISNPNYGAPAVGVAPPPNGNHSGPGPMPPYGRGNSPPPEVRPIIDDRVPSPGSGYPHQQYQHHLNPTQPGGIATGAPPPTAALAAAEAAAARERDDRPPAGFKRPLDPEDDYKMSNKKPANGDSRGRLDDHHHHRAPSTERVPSPRERHRRTSSEARRENQQRANDNYHPSEAAHHPPTLPSMHQAPHQQPQQEHLPPISEVPRDERREPYEAAARKMEVDEDYDDEGEDDKRLTAGSGARNSPQRGMMNGPTKTEP